MGRIDQPGILAQALLYLACKSEETERYLRDIITVEHAILYPGHVLHLNEEYSAIRNLIVMNEQLILRFLGFDLNVELPYLYMYNYLYSMKASRGLAGVATGILNDMFSTLLVIKYAPPELACGAIYFATKLLSSRYFLPMEEEQELEQMIPELLRMDRSGVLMHQWFLTLDVTLESVLEISERLIEMYSWPYYGISDTFKRKKEEGELN